MVWFCCLLLLLSGSPGLSLGLAVLAVLFS